MLNVYNILETIRMIQDECLDIRTITMGISLLDCIDTDIDKACEKVYNWMVDPETDYLLEKCTSAYHDGEHEFSLIYGDYYFLEGILKLTGSEFFLW